MTEPLYHHDAYLAAFDADVTAAHPDGLVLDRSADFAEAVEAAVNKEVEADRPVHVAFLSAEEFLSRPELIRTKSNLVPAGLEVIRVIDIEGLDRQADGGTHVARTAEVGTVRVVGHESKGKGNKRLRIALDAAPARSPGSA
jgi:misacylated tRNA(Ala) deacylase